MKHKTIICTPENFDKKYSEWVYDENNNYRNSLNEEEIFCHKSWFNIIVNDIKHDGNNHYISFIYNNGGSANTPDDEGGFA